MSVDKGRSLLFTAATDAREPFDIYWKVRNFGPEAVMARDLRGAIYRDDGSRRRTESTRYRGNQQILVSAPALFPDENRRFRLRISPLSAATTLKTC